MRSSVHARMPPRLRRSLTKLGADIAIARKRRRLTMAMMAERLGVAVSTYQRVERGDPTSSLGLFAMTFFVLGMGEPLGDLMDAGRDETGLLLETERLPQRVRRKRPQEEP